MPKDSRLVQVDVLEDLVRNSGLTFNDKNKKSWVFDCPKCGKKERLYIRRKDGRFVCFYCRDKTIEGFSGAPEYALSMLLDRSVSDLQDLLYGPEFHVGPVLEDALEWNADHRYRPQDGPQVDTLETEEYVDLPEETAKLQALPYPPDYRPIDHKQSLKGLAYLESRGITLEVALRYQLAYDTRRRRVVFPVYTRGVLVGWQARAIGDTQWVDRQGVEHNMPKILTTMLPSTRDFVLMFEPRLEGSPHAVLVEGPVDAIKCDLCGGNVASMGKSVSKGQLDRLLAFGIRRLYLGLDPDASDEMSLLIKAYHEKFEIFHMTPEGTGYEDFGAMPPEVALECFHRAEPAHPTRLFSYLDPDVTPRF